MINGKISPERFVREYVKFSLLLAKRELPYTDFCNRLYKILFRGAKLSMIAQEYAVQVVMANLHFFQNQNGNCGDFGDRWLYFSEPIVKIKREPPESEKFLSINGFLGMYTQELESRLGNPYLNNSRRQF